MERNDKEMKKKYYVICIRILAAVSVLAVVYTMIHTQ